MKIFWGHPNNYFNITNICYDKLLNNNIITINKSEEFKLNLFGDPMPSLIKHIKILDIEGNSKFYNHNEEDIIINIHDIFPQKLNIYWNNYNITDICFKKCINNNNIIIPYDEEEKIKLFGDPYPGIVKYIKIINKYGFSKIFNNQENIILDINKSYIDVENYFYKNKFNLKDKNLEKNNISKKKILIVISSKSPNLYLYDCINNLYKIQIDHKYIYKICVIDSDSEDFTNYNIIKNEFPDVELYFIKNKNYEYGAWKYAYSIYSNYDLYFCIQDSIIIKNKITIDNIDNKNIYTFHHNSGYSLPSGYYTSDEVKKEGIKNLEDSGLDYKTLIDTDFCLAQHNSFIINNFIIKDIYKILKNPPINKIGCCFYERNFGLYFLIKNINTINLHNYMIKYHGNRD